MAFAKDDLYTDLILELFKNPSNHGKLENPDLYVEGGNPLCGDQVSFTMKIENNKILDIKFQSIGCAISTASDSLVTDLVKGKSIDEIKKLKDKDLFTVLGNIIETRLKCALLGLWAVQKGLEHYSKNPAKNKVAIGIKI